LECRIARDAFVLLAAAPLIFSTMNAWVLLVEILR
jgi:hypothetical protein